MWYVRPAKPQISLCIHAYSMSVKLLTEHNLEFLSLKECCTGSSESTLVRMSHSRSRLKFIVVEHISKTNKTRGIAVYNFHGLF